jgi:hypothetical protein
MQDSGLKTWVSKLCMFLEYFANGHSMNTLFDVANTLNENNDEALRKWFRSLNSYDRLSSTLYVVFSRLI